MRKNITLTIISFLILFLLTGCGGSGSNPSTPSTNNPGYHVLIGAWTADFNLNALTVNVFQNDDDQDSYNVVNWFEQPRIVIKSYDPSTRIIEATFTIKNSSTEDAYDPRLIFLNINDTSVLENPDQYTHLYAPVESLDIYPFKAFAKDEERRCFTAGQEYSEDIQIHFPEGFSGVTFLLDAAFRGNVEEPYEFENLSQTPMFGLWRCTSYLQVDVMDWDGEVDEVYLRCKEVTDQSKSYFTKILDHTWAISISNAKIVPPGEYDAVLVAHSGKSEASVLCDRIKISVIKDTFPPKWVATTGLTDAAPGDGQVTVFWNMAVDGESRDFCRYLVYCDTDDQPWDQVPVDVWWHNPYTFTGLENGKTYYFAVRAKDNADPPNVDQNTVVISAVPHTG